MKSNRFQLDELAQLVRGESIGQHNLVLENLASLEQAQPHHIAFVNGEKYIEAAQASKAGALIIPAVLQSKLTAHQNFIIVYNSYISFAMLKHAF